MTAQTAAPTQRSLTESLQEYARGVAGGLVFSLPLLYTMEMWWAGFIAHPARLIVYVVVTFFLLLGYNRYAGMRPDAGWLEVVIDSVEEMGIGLIVATGVLFLLGQLAMDMALNEIMGKIVVEAMTVAIGVSVGTAQLGTDEDNEGSTGDRAGAAGMGVDTDGEPHFGGQLVIAVCGAVLFAANVAPTEEIILIAIEASTWRVLGLALLSLALAALILYGSDFKGAQQFAARDGKFPILRGTIVTYGVALVTAAVILWFFGRFDGTGLLPALKQIVVLGLPAALGASGGRLLLQVR